MADTEDPVEEPVEPPADPPQPRYVTVEDLRDEGISSEEVSDDRLRKVLLRVEAMIDDATGQFFTPREMVLELDGSGSRYLHLSIPIIEVSVLRVNGSPDPLDPAYYRAFTRRSPPQDDRRNPKIELISHQRSIFDSPVRAEGSRFIFHPGRTSVVEGIFGFTEADGSVPPPIQWAVLRIASRDWPRLNTPEANEKRRDRKVVEEETDYHRVRYKGANARGTEGSTLFDDEEVGKIVEKYRAPFRISAPRGDFRR